MISNIWMQVAWWSFQQVNFFLCTLVIFRMSDIKDFHIHPTYMHCNNVCAVDRHHGRKYTASTFTTAWKGIWHWSPELCPLSFSLQANTKSPLIISLFGSISDPEWASYNIGVFLCQDCAGIHRSMGTHISKIKSIKLDNWEDSQLEVRKTLTQFSGLRSVACVLVQKLKMKYLFRIRGSQSSIRFISVGGSFLCGKAQLIEHWIRVW